MKSILNSISKKHFLIYLVIGAVCTIGHMLVKADSLLLTRISDGLFAGAVIPACAGIYFWMKGQRKSCIEPFAAANLYLVASVVFMSLAMYVK